MQGTNEKPAHTAVPVENRTGGDVAHSVANDEDANGEDSIEVIVAEVFGGFWSDEGQQCGLWRR